MRPLLRRVVAKALRSQRVPFALRSRLAWRRSTGRWIARRPTTFTAKVRWKMLKDRRPLLHTFADKAAVRSYVERVAGAEYLTECYAVVSDPAELERESLPRQFVAKVSHASGGIWIVSDAAPDPRTVVHGVRQPGGTAHWERVLVRPDAFEWPELVEALRTWLLCDYSDAYLEWAYRGLERRVIVEELLATDAGGVPDDYKIFVLNGTPRLVEVHSNRYLDHRRNFFLPDWTPLDVEYVYRRGAEVPRPASLEEMIRVAEALGQVVDFVRVDLYEVGGRVVFGELTNYPEAGSGSFDPPSFDEELGAWWHLPARY